MQPKSTQSDGSDDRSPFTIAEAAARLGLKPVTLRSWVARRKLAFHKLGRAIRVPQAEVERLLRESFRPAVQ